MGSEQLRDKLDSELNDWYEEIFFKDLKPSFIMMHDKDFDLIFRTAGGNLRPHLIRTGKRINYLPQYYYRSVLIIRSPDIPSSMFKII